MTSRTSDQIQAQGLLSAAAVRAASQQALALARKGELADWRLDESQLPICAEFVAKVIRERYPTLEVPFHARWRHFVFGGRDAWADRARDTAWADPDARARAEFDLAINSVLLDAGAGAAWVYQDDATGARAQRSEGLALASLRWFERGALSTKPDGSLRADAARLARLGADDLGAAFQVSPGNSLLGLEGRAALLNRLGAQCEARPDLFATADTPRPGGLYDALKTRAVSGVLPAPIILEALLEGLGPIWENRPSLGEVPLGDCWPHPQLGFVPLHKLSQWLAYSLIEPLERAGVRVGEVDGLTGLAEYRNGGLFIDAGVLVAREPAALERTHDVSAPLIVAWRSLTVALLDAIAPLVRDRLGLAARDFPLARVLEGGTWAAGRILANQRRSEGGPPLKITSDGTVF